MKIQSVSISGLIQVNDEVCLNISHPTLKEIQPGQFLQVMSAEDGELLPTILYPCGMLGSSRLFSGDLPKSWQPGVEIHFRGPRGNGFHLPPLARRVAFTSLDFTSLNPLLPLADEALNNGAEVTVVSEKCLTNLAAEVEVLPLSELHQIKEWSDYLAAMIPARKITEFQRALEVQIGTNTNSQIEVLVQTPIICDEVSGCGACAVNTSRGWKLACKDGPVFSLDELVLNEGNHG